MRVPRHVVDDRRAALAEWVRQRRYLSLAEVCEKFQISEATARRDLRAIEGAGGIVRAFGGAYGDFDHSFQSFSDRMDAAAGAKKAIACEAASRVQDGMTLFIDGGTTLFYVARELTRRSFSSLKVLTYNLAAAEALSGHAPIEVNLSGGEFFGRQSVLLGPIALHSIRSLRFDLALLGALALDRHGVYNTRTAVIELQKAVISRSRDCLLCLDRSKLGKSGDHRFLTPEEIPPCLTDARPADLRKHGLAHLQDRFISVHPA